MEDNNEIQYKNNEDDNNSIKIESLENSEGPAIYGNNINGNDWMKDYNTRYPLKIGERMYPTLEHYLQYRRYCYIMGTQHCQYFYEKIVSKDFSSYYELISYVNEKLPYYKGTTEALQEVYNLLYEDYILARFVKAMTYQEIRNYLHKMNKENITPQQVIDCNKSTSSMDEKELHHFKITLMHIQCNDVQGFKKDPWITVHNLITVRTNDA